MSSRLKNTVSFLSIVKHYQCVVIGRGDSKQTYLKTFELEGLYEMPPPCLINEIIFTQHIVNKSSKRFFEQQKAALVRKS